MPKTQKKEEDTLQNRKKTIFTDDKFELLMERDEFFTKEERELLFSLYKKLLRLTGETLQKGDCRKLKKHLIDSTQNNTMQRDSFGLNPVIKDMQTAVIVAEEIRHETGIYFRHYATHACTLPLLYNRIHSTGVW